MSVHIWADCAFSPGNLFFFSYLLLKSFLFGESSAVPCSNASLVTSAHGKKETSLLKRVVASPIRPQAGSQPFHVMSIYPGISLMAIKKGFNRGLFWF